jgi:membrane-bound lytic murein transglycosylase A
MPFFMVCWLIVFSSFATPTQKVLESISFSDDIDYKNLDLALSRQLKSFDSIGLSGTVTYGGVNYSKSVLKDSIKLFQTLIKEFQECVKVSSKEICENNLNLAINQKFDIYKPVPGPQEPGSGNKETTLYTAYFSPDFVGSTKQTERFKHAIYRMPGSVELKSKRREEIDFDGALSNRGLELFWVEESLFDLYILHVEGGGRVRVQQADGSFKNYYLSYAGVNGHKFQFISKYMVQRGYLTSSEATIENQRSFLEQNPSLAREIFASSPSYVYFKTTEDEPMGVNSIPLTEGRSLAIDTKVYQDVGVINFVKARKAVRENNQTYLRPFSRFFISQDTGGAIRGNARCDLYFGFGHEAEFIAHSTKTMGEQYFLIKKR